MSSGNASSGGYYGSNCQVQKAVISSDNKSYQIKSGVHADSQSVFSDPSCTLATTTSDDFSASGLQFPNSPPLNVYNSSQSQQQPWSSDVQFQLSYQTGLNSTVFCPPTYTHAGALINSTSQSSCVNNDLNQAYSAPQNQDPPPVSNYFSQPYPQYFENHVPANTCLQQAPSLSSSSAVTTAGQSFSHTSPSPNYKSPSHLSPHPRQSQLQDYESERVSSVDQVIATETTQMDKSIAMPQLYPAPLVSPGRTDVPTTSVQQLAYNSHLNSQPLQSPSLSRHHQVSHRLRSVNVTRPIQDQQLFGSFNRQNSVERAPGTQLSSDEWNALKCSVSLVHDSNFLPSDGPEKPPLPILTTQVNCHPDFMRSTLTAVPISSKLQSRCRLPFGLLAHPFRDVNDLPVIQTSVIVRCRSCRLYINPFVKFTDSGRRWRCPVCLLSNSVPDDFYYDPSTQTYGDPARRPEIRNATVEFIAPSDYMLRPPQAATYVFCLEASRFAVTTGYLELVCNMLADNLAKMPGDSRRQIAILTYDSGLQFYILSGKKMRMVICQDLSEVFLPDLNGMVNRINDCLEPIIELLRQIPKEFANTQETSNCLGFALQTVLKLIGNTGGRVTVFNTSIPTLGPGALECRETHDDLTKPGSEHLRPASDFYRTIALDFSSAYIAVDLFILNSSYCDVATISGVSRYSGGSVYHYPNFHYDSKAYDPPLAPATSDNTIPTGDANSQSDQRIQKQKKVGSHEVCGYVEVESLRKDFHRYLMRKIGFEAVFRLRCTRGISVQNFYGNFFMRSVDLLNLPVVNPDAGYAMQLEITERLDSFPQVVLQSALLYTSAYGDRRIRVHTLCLPVTDSPEAIFNYADEGAVACLVAKMAVERTISSGLGNAREALTTVMSDILTAYQKERSVGSSRPTLSGICPSSLRLLPAYLCGTLRFTAFRNCIPTSLDVRSGALELIIGASAPQTLALLYPRLYAVNSFISEPICGKAATLAQKTAALSLNDSIPPPLPCLPLTGKSIIRDGIYLLDTGNLIILLVGYGIPAADLKSLIGYTGTDELTVEKRITKLRDLSEGEKAPPPRRRLQTLIKSIQRDRCLGTALVLIRHDVPEPLKGRFINALVEDRTPTCPSYSEYIQMILNGHS